MKKPNRIVAVLLTALCLVLSGCLVEEEEQEEGLEVPDDRKDASLVVDGEVDSPLNLSLEELVALGTEDFTATFVNSVGTTRTANYTGVRLQKVLDEAGVKDSAELVRVEASDGYAATLFLSDVKDTTHLAVREDDDWLYLPEDGALKLVDTDLPSVYWVRFVVRLELGTSETIEVAGLANNTEPISAAYVHDNGVEVQWMEGVKNRTGMGIEVKDLLATIDADLYWGYLIDLWDPVSGSVLVPTQEALSEDGHYLAINSAGNFLYVRGLLIWKAPIERLTIAPGIKVFGEVGQAMCMTVEDLKDLTHREVEYKGSTYGGAALEAVLAEVGPEAGVDAVSVIAKDGYHAVLPYANLTTAVLAYEVDGVALGPEEGYIKLVDSVRPGNYQVREVVWLDVYNSTPIEASGLVNVTDILDIGWLDANADRDVTYNDGRKDRTYPGVSWEVVLEALDYDSSSATLVNVTAEGGATVSWQIADLLGKEDNGLAVDSGGTYVAVKEGLGDYVPVVVSLEVG